MADIAASIVVIQDMDSGYKDSFTATRSTPYSGTPASTVYYRQRAYQISTGSLVFWEYTSPDPTGLHAVDGSGNPIPQVDLLAESIVFLGEE